MDNKPNTQVLLVRRPHGAPVAEDFSISEVDRPSPGPGQVLLENLYLSIDPYLRGRMRAADDSYAQPFRLGEPMGGATLARVVRSVIEDFDDGDLVVSYSGWQRYALSDGSDLRRVPPDLVSPTHALGVLGMTGFTA